jgi:hypothetical protein
MAKEDFCFTYYDGDAARDMAHMNRLERGCYTDLIISQRKFGHLSFPLIKKTLGNDFTAVWESLEIILKKDDQDKFFIEWLDNSIEKMRRQSIHQSENGKKGGRPKKANENPNHNQNESQSITQEKPLENENGYEIETDSLGKDKGMGKGKQKIDEQQEIPANVLEAAEMNQWTLHKSRHTEFIKSQWGVFLKERNNDPPVKRMLYIRQSSELYQYFLNWIRNKKPVNGSYKKSSSKSSGAIELVDSLKSDLRIDD